MMDNKAEVKHSSTSQRASHETSTFLFQHKDAIEQRKGEKCKIVRNDHKFL